MNLVSTVIAISLTAMAIGAGISYVNPSAQATAETTAVIAGGFQTLAQAYQSRQMTGAPPPDAASWQSALFPAYGSEPKPPTGMSWSYGVNAAGRWFCLTAPKVSAAQRSAFASVAKRYAAASYQVSASCGDGAAAASASPAASPGGDSLSATLWVAREAP